jgi:methionyl-tRNA formyltransferase
MSASDPAIVLVGVHFEAARPFRHLLDSRANLVGLVTLAPEARATVSGAIDLAAPAEAAGVPVLFVRQVNEPGCVEWIRRLAPDLLIVVGWTQLLREELLSIPKIACLGFHASLLPRYRGRAPINWVLINGETETGNTMMVLEPGADEGDIVAQRRILITDEDDCRTLYEKVGATEISMLAEVLPLVRQGALPRRKQDSTQATVMPKRRPQDGGMDWSWSTKALFNWVRALTHPYPGAFCRLGERKLWIWKAEKSDQPFSTLVPGCVVLDGNGWPLASTGDGWLRLLRLQLEGGPETSGLEAAAAYLPPGTILERMTEKTNESSRNLRASG